MNHVTPSAPDTRQFETLEQRLVFSQDLMFDFTSASAQGSGAGGAIVAGVDSISIDAVVRNRGNQDSFKSDLKVIFTRDLEIPDSDREDVSIGRLRLPDLDVEESYNVRRTFEVPDLESGTYYVFLRLRPEHNFGLFDAWKDPWLNNTSYTGLRVVVDGSEAPNDPGLETGGVKVTLRGAGQVSVNRREDGQFNVLATGTNSNSRLIIEPARGYNHLGDIVVRGPLSLFEMQVALPGNLTIDGDVREVKLRYVLGSQITLNGTGRETIFSARNLDGASLTAAAPLKSVKTGAWLSSFGGDGLIVAPAIKDLKIQGSLGVDVRLSGVSGRSTLDTAIIDDSLLSDAFTVRGNIKLFRAQSLLNDAALTVLGDVRDLDIRGDVEGTVTATNFKKIAIKGDLINSTILAGAFLGNDGQLGGGDDTFTAGRIDDFSCLDDVRGSYIGAGVNPVNGVLDDGNDRFVNTSGSRIGKIAVKDRLFDSIFVSPSLPSRVKVGGNFISTFNDDRFVTNLGQGV